MPRRLEQFEKGEFYHITIRRLGGDTLFRDESDRFRGIFSIYEFNNTNPVTIRERRKERLKEKTMQTQQIIRVPDSDNFDSQIQIDGKGLLIIDKRDKLVKMHTFCEMENHFHFSVSQLKDGGISKFMNKFGSGYSRYFKDKYQLEDKGYFFDGRFYVVHIQNEDQLRTVFVYDHVNPLSIIEPGWKERGIQNPKRAIKFLEEKYRWSSYWDYLGKKNFPSVTSRNFILEIMGGPDGCRRAVNDWIEYKADLRKFQAIGLPLD